MKNFYSMFQWFIKKDLAFLTVCRLKKIRKHQETELKRQRDIDFMAKMLKVSVEEKLKKEADSNVLSTCFFPFSLILNQFVN